MSRVFRSFIKQKLQVCFVLLRIGRLNRDLNYICLAARIFIVNVHVHVEDSGSGLLGSDIFN